MEDDIVRQVAALPCRFDEDGNLEVMLITSRGRHRWIPPKGNLMRGISPHEAAAREAYEEAGVIGRVSSEPLGSFKATKSGAEGVNAVLDITLFPLEVDRRAEDWPERGLRTILWFEPEGAARVVKEPGLAALISRFRPSKTGLDRPSH
ncbi:NUDIX hydrolase [Sphingomonas oryzagri]